MLRTQEQVVIYVDGEPFFNVVPRMAASLVDLMCDWPGVKVITLEKIEVPV